MIAIHSIHFRPQNLMWMVDRPITSHKSTYISTLDSDRSITEDGAILMALHDEEPTKTNTDSASRTRNEELTTMTTPRALEASADPGHQTPTFLTLPLELRLEIYTQLLRLPSRGAAKPGFHSGHPTPGTGTSTIHPQILSACRQTHVEALPLLYRLNTYTAHPSLLASFPRLRPWYAPVSSASMASLIRRFRLRVRLDADPAFTAAAAQAAFSGMEEVEIEVWQAAYRGAGREVLGLFEGVRGVKRARVTGSTGGFGEYAAWLEGVMMTPEGEAVAEFRGVM
ncbi:hypothetical protein BJ170DRAFT_122428 [Xylariales sp. AK1849]|nr:hypothetical protein BJ170DRAFT_122428 [Xylariales sp. AK1849]